MQLFFAPPSPYARKARIVIAEKGLADRITMTLCAPFESPPELLKVNPLSKIPALVLGDGTVLYDSPLICEYLDALTPEPKLIPNSGPARWRSLRRQALADGLLDAAVAILLEGRRPEAERSKTWVARQSAAVDRALDALASDIATFDAIPDIAHIANGAALGFLDFRHPAIDWRNGRTALADWYAAFAARPSMVSTAPHA